MDFKPTKTRIIVRPDPVEEMSPGGIHIPSEAQKIPHMGTVLATGPGRHEGKRFIATDVSVGDKVCWMPAMEDGAYIVGEKVESGGEKLLMMNDFDLLGVVECV